MSAPITLYKEVYGTGDPILCLHGLGASLFTWRHFIAPFSKDNQLILVDFKGSGKSPKPFGSDYSIAAKADDIYNLIVEQNLRNLTLVGNSLGGGVALLVAIRLIEEEPSRLKRLVLIGSAGDKRYLPWPVKVIRSIVGWPLIHLAPSRLAAKVVLRTCYYDGKKASNEQVEAYATPIADRGGRHALLQTAKQCIPANADDLIAKLRNLKVPTLLLWGRQDKVIPLIVGELLHELIPNSQLEVIEECGHIPQEEKPEASVALVSRFLQMTS